MSKPKLAIVVGISRVGKDEFAKSFVQSGYRYRTMADAMKRQIERNHNLPHGAMEQDEYRHRLINPANPELGTFLDLMIEKSKQKRSRQMVAVSTMEFLRDNLTDTVLVGVRFPSEVNTLSNLSVIYDVRWFIVSRKDTLPLASDQEVDQAILQIYRTGQPVMRVPNDGSITQLNGLADFAIKSMHLPQDNLAKD